MAGLIMSETQQLSLPVIKLDTRMMKLLEKKSWKGSGEDSIFVLSFTLFLFSEIELTFSWKIYFICEKVIEGRNCLAL